MKKNIAIFVYDDIEILDFTGPYEIFSIADELRSGNLFNLFLVSEHKSRLIARNNFKFEADYQFYKHPKIDYLLIPGGPGARVQENNDNVLNWIELQFFKIEHLLTICTGSRILANTKILSNEQVTTHWNSVNDLKVNKGIKVIHNVRYTDNGKILTSGGVSSGMDLCLYFLEKKKGKKLSEELKQYIEWRPQNGNSQSQPQEST